MIKHVNKCVIKQLINVFLYSILFLIGIKHKKCVSVASEDPFLIAYCLDKYKTQRMCDKAVDDCLAAVKLVHDWFFD